MNRKIRYFLLSLLAFIPALHGCVETELTYIPDRADDRVYFIYMAADNSLGRDGYALSNLSSIEKAVSWLNIGKGRVMVFYDPYNSPCKMLEYKAGHDGKPTKTVLAEYSDLNSASPATLRFAIDEMKKFATAGGRKVNTYILDLWSHGNSWEPMNPAPASATPAPRAVVQDGNYWMNLDDFTEAIEPGLFDAVIFAECYGSSLEMAYLMRNKTNYIIGSAAEMPAFGVQYDRVLPYVFQKETNYKAYCMSYYEYWKNTSPYTATIAWFDCKAFTDDFIGIMKEIYRSGEYSQLLGRMNSAESMSDFEVQFYDRPNRGPKKYFDLGDMVNQAFPDGGDLYQRFWNAFDKIVIYAISTDNMWEGMADSERFSGMTTYMTLDWSDYYTNYTSANNDYKKTTWYKVAYPINN